jgi:hypothetical protein
LVVGTVFINGTVIVGGVDVTVVEMGAVEVLAVSVIVVKGAVEAVADDDEGGCPVVTAAVMGVVCVAAPVGPHPIASNPAARIGAHARNIFLYMYSSLLGRFRPNRVNNGNIKDNMILKFTL